MKASQLFVIALGVLCLPPVVQSEELAPLRIPHVLGTHHFGKRMSVEIIANTKAELSYSVTVDGKSRGGAALETKTGEEAVFWWEEEKAIFWFLTKKTIARTDYSNPQSTSTKFIDMESLSTEASKLPKQVVELAEGLKNKQR